MSTGLSTYNYFMSSYASSLKANRYDTHKKSELKNIYNSIVKMNKDNPIYMFKKSEEASALAVDIKESARKLTNTMASIASDRYGDDKLFNKRVAFSSNSDVLDVTYIGEDESDAEDLSFQIEVNALAKPQINKGNSFYPNDEVMLKPGNYSFDVAVNELNYELQFSVNPGDNNQTLLERVAKLFNKSSMGINASMNTADYGQVYLELTSTATGDASYGDLIFGIGANDSTGSNLMVDYLGINKVDQLSSNSSFLLNGAEKSSFSNTFTVNKNFEITLNETSNGNGATTIGFKTTADSIADNIGKLADSFNNVLDTAKGNGKGFVSSKLLREVGNFAQSYKNELESLGINVDEEGYLQVDQGLLTANLGGEAGSKEIAESMKSFQNDLAKITKRILLNPMDYTDKTLVAYKNPQVQHYNTPYFTSAYSGMMFNTYC